MDNTEASNRPNGGDSHSKSFVKITVKALHQLIWDKPISAIAKDWEINSQVITKACDKHGVPNFSAPLDLSYVVARTD